MSAAEDPLAEGTPAAKQVRIGELTAHLATLLDRDERLNPDCEACREIARRIGLSLEERGWH